MIALVVGLGVGLVAVLVVAIHFAIILPRQVMRLVYTEWSKTQRAEIERIAMGNASAQVAETFGGLVGPMGVQLAILKGLCERAATFAGASQATTAQVAENFVEQRVQLAAFKGLCEWMAAWASAQYAQARGAVTDTPSPITRLGPAVAPTQSAEGPARARPAPALTPADGPETPRLGPPSSRPAARARPREETLIGLGLRGSPPGLELDELDPAPQPTGPGAVVPMHPKRASSPTLVSVAPPLSTQPSAEIGIEHRSDSPRR